MEPAFEVEFEVTPALYYSWLRRPLGKKAVQARRAAWVLEGIIALMGLLLVMLYGGVFRLLGIFFVLLAAERAFLRPELAIRRQYQAVLEVNGGQRWIRRIIFADRVTVVDGRSQVASEYRDFTALTEDNGDFCLWQGENYLLRVPRKFFVKGSPADFGRFIAERNSALA
ncbi:MAG: hypothetical protein HFE45_04970 [Oscillospiraceae bacterium]|jgi:hypothetical protein|nr:hypothetical protein [Oscillospiraceae bacterium]